MKTRAAAGSICLILLLGSRAPLTVFAGTGGLGAGAKARLFTGGVQAELQIETDESAERLQPGGSACYRMTLTNQKKRAWVRVKLELEAGDALREQLPVILSGMSGYAVMRGDYLYCTKALSEGESILLCEGIEIPDLTFVPEEEHFLLRAVPEAMQDSGLVPNFWSSEPWEQMLSSTVSPDGTIFRRTEGGPVLRFEKEKQVLSGILFEGMGALMPGETVTETLQIENAAGGSYYVRMKLHPDGLSDKEQKLLSALKLRIERDGAVLYEGSMLDNALKNGIGLGYCAKASEKLELTVEVPKDLSNALSDTEACPQVSFEAVRRSGSGGSGSGSGSRPSGQSGNSGMETLIYDEPDASVKNGISGGTWTLLDEKTHRWSYTLPGGKQAADGWLYLFNPYASGGQGENAWFKFNPEAVMEYGWIRSENGNWYHCSDRTDGSLGQLEKGWHRDETALQVYYLDPVSGIMQTGWRKIDGREYYFASLEDIPEQTWYYEAFDRTFGETSFGKWIYKRIGVRSYGSMYCNERTPGGSMVDETGAKKV
ncbi:MAG: hypothetical protein Q4C63_05660 [Eubacteriales bacterium]|nr:hypothetical protein [Eubacteriales bacterium]